MKLELLDSFKRLLIGFVAAAGLSPQATFSQARFLHEISNEQGAQVAFGSNYSTLKSALANNLIYYTPQYPGEKFELRCHDITTLENSKVRIENPKNAKILQAERVESIAINGNKLVIISSDHIVSFELTSATSARCTGTIGNKYLFKKCLPLGENFLLYVNYNYHPMDAPHKHVWAKFNPKTQKITDATFQAEENSIFGSLVNSWIDTKDSKIVYADPLNYRITFYNDQFQVVDSIQTNEFDSNETSVKPFRKSNLNSKDAVYKLMAVDDSLLTRIRKVYYLNDTTILALIKSPAKESIRADYWQRQNGKWTRNFQDTSTPWFAEGEAYSKDNMTYTDFIQNVYDLSYLGNYTFAEVYFPYIPTVTTSNFDRDSDYFKWQNDAIQNKEVYFGIRQIHIDLPVRQ